MDDEFVKIKLHDDFNNMMNNIDRQSMIDAVSYFMYSVADGDISPDVELTDIVDDNTFMVLYSLGEIKYIDIDNNITITPNENLIELLTKYSIDDLRAYPMICCTKSTDTNIYKTERINNFICTINKENKNGKL